MAMVQGLPWPLVCKHQCAIHQKYRSLYLYKGCNGLPYVPKAPCDLLPLWETTYPWFMFPFCKRYYAKDHEFNLRPCSGEPFENGQSGRFCLNGDRNCCFNRYRGGKKWFGIECPPLSPTQPYKSFERREVGSYKEGIYTMEGVLVSSSHRDVLKSLRWDEPDFMSIPISHCNPSQPKMVCSPLVPSSLPT